MSTSFVLLLKIPLARLADPRIMLFQEILYTPHAHFDVIAANWASYFPIDDDKIMIGLKSSKYHQFPSVSDIYLSVNAAVPTSRFWQIFHSARHSFGTDNGTS